MSNQAFASPDNPYWLASTGIGSVSFIKQASPPLAFLNKGILYELVDGKLYYNGEQVDTTPNEAVLQSQDWTPGGGGVIPTDPGSPFSFFLPFTTDATVAIGPQGLLINPAPQAYTHTVDQGGILSPFAIPTGVPELDHAKYLVLSDPFDVPDDGREIGFRMVVAAKQTFDPLIKFPPAFSPYIKNLNEDMRPCGFWAVVVDDDPDAQNLVLDTCLTNSKIYAFPEKGPFLKLGFPGNPAGPLPDYNGYRAATQIGSRAANDPLNDFVEIQMRYNRQKGVARWLVNGVEEHSLNLIGAPPPAASRLLNFEGPVRHTEAQRLRFGFGLFAVLDGCRPLDPTVDPGEAATNKPLVAIWPARANAFAPNPAVGGVIQPDDVYYDPIRVVQGNGPDAGDPQPFFTADFADPTSAPGSRLFGQGAQAIIKTWEVFTV